MWQAPNQRVRALQSAKKRQMDRLRKPLHIQRVKAEIKITNPQSGENQVSEARAILNDISKRGMGVFSPHPLSVGQEITITIDQPRQIFLRGKVVWCQEFETSRHVLSANPFNYRLGVKFIFNSAQDEEAVAAYCEELNRHHLQAQAA